MHWGLVRTIIVLPGTVLVFIPAIILLLTKDSGFLLKPTTPSQIWFWLALLAASIGLYKLRRGNSRPLGPPEKAGYYWTISLQQKPNDHWCPAAALGRGIIFSFLVNSRMDDSFFCW
jgi:hypothetical protein